MKKAKIFLTALTVLAVVGGALAFKTKQLFEYYTCDTVIHSCVIPFTTTFETIFGGTEIKPYDIWAAPCPDNICQTMVRFSD